MSARVFLTSGRQHANHSGAHANPGHTHTHTHTHTLTHTFYTIQDTLKTQHTRMNFWLNVSTVVWFHKYVSGSNWHLTFILLEFSFCFISRVFLTVCSVDWTSMWLLCFGVFVSAGRTRVASSRVSTLSQLVSLSLHSRCKKTGFYLSCHLIFNTRWN